MKDKTHQGAQPSTKKLPELMVEKDFQSNDWIVWSTTEHQEVFRGTREDAVKFSHAKVN